MSTEYIWSELRDRAISLYEDSPSAAQEARVVEVFERHPALVSAEISAVAEAFQAGRIRAAWPILIHRIEEAETREQRAKNIIATDLGDRDAKVARAEQWVRTAGVHFDRESEVLEELFERGVLRPWENDVALRTQIAAFWREQRPRGEKTEREAEERARIYVEGQRRLRAGEPAPG